MVNTKFKSGGLHEKHVVATWNVVYRLSICLYTQGNQEKPVSKYRSIYLFTVIQYRMKSKVIYDSEIISVPPPNIKRTKVPKV